MFGSDRFHSRRECRRPMGAGRAEDAKRAEAGQESRAGQSNVKVAREVGVISVAAATAARQAGTECSGAVD